MKENRLPYHKQSGFKVPEDYFGNFEERMMVEMFFEENKLRQTPFKVPENYFEQLEGRVFEKLEVTPKKGKVISLFNRRTLSYVAGIAAVLSVLLTSVVFNQSQDPGFEDLDITAVENYLLESIDHDDPKNIPENYDFTASANPNIDKEALLEYLNENIEEPALLLNED